MRRPTFWRDIVAFVRAWSSGARHQHAEAHVKHMTATRYADACAARALAAKARDRRTQHDAEQRAFSARTAALRLEVFGQ